MNKLSAIVLAYNNEDIIGRFAQSVAWTDELVLVDSGSIDRTVEVARTHHPRCVVVERPFDNFCNQRNFGLEHTTGDWVMHFDSDHVMTASLKDEIQRLLRDDTPAFDAYNVVQRLYWRARLLAHVGGPCGFGVFLHRRGVARFESQIHEKCVTDRDVGMLTQALDHVTEQSLAQRIVQMADYVEREVDSILRGQRTIESGRVNMFWRPLRRLLCDVALRRAYRDGVPGIAWAGITAFRTFLIQFRYWEAVNGGWGEYPAGAPLCDSPPTADGAGRPAADAACREHVAT
jgi:glycosyltransferase involved in cell wall biosynthesis